MEILQIMILLLAFVHPSIIAARKPYIDHETDKQALLFFKENMNDNSGILNSWNGSVHYCKWIGVSCSHKHPQRVSALHLSSSGLMGPIPASIGNLTFLKKIDLSSNELYGEIPFSVGHLHRLEYLNLANNSLHGEVPVHLYNCSELVSVNISYNQLYGEISSWVGSLSKLESLDFEYNNLTGIIPTSFTNLSSLAAVVLNRNHIEGPIPSDIGRLTRLKYLYLGINHLSGTIPQSFSNLTSLIQVALYFNELHDHLPINIGTNLHNLRYFIVDYNQFSGTIPPSLSNASKIDELDLGYNNFTSTIPLELGKLCPTIIDLPGNALEAKTIEDWKFLELLTNCSRLRTIELSFNQLGGKAPSFIANLTKQLMLLNIQGNYLSGEIPSDIGNLLGLTVLGLNGNFLTGNIPQGIGKLQKLEKLGFSGNNFSGSIPFSTGNLSNVYLLWLDHNNLEGSIPTSIGNLSQLITLHLDHNTLTGTLPKSIFNLPSLSIGIDLSYNFFVGSIPVEVGSLTKAGDLILSRNNFSGEIPETITNCQSLQNLALDGNLFYGNIPSFLSKLNGLQMLNLANNYFSGAIPQELGYINGLQELYLDHNNLSGNIPETLENLSHLVTLNLSNNNFEGQVPTKGVFGNITGLDILGNKRLCGGIPQLFLPKCPPHHKNKHSKLVFELIIPISSIVLFLALSLIFLIIYWRQKSRNKSKPGSFQNDKYPKVSYVELVQATEDFSAANMIGAGRYGSVYKGILALEMEGNVIQKNYDVAIKVFNLQLVGSSRSFLVECGALSRIRHRNLIHVITCCSTIDYKGNDFKAIVLDFMPNGSLDGWLYRKINENEQLNTLSLIQRLNIAIDVANALDYLHNNCEPPLVHCDLKPSNILLNEDMSACVGDFGIAKFLVDPISKSSIDSQSSVGIRGSIGYIPPEYGAGGAVSTWGDVYSFGIVLLEVFTGKSPTDEMFNNGLTLNTYVQMAFPERVMYIIDPTLIIPDDDNPSIIHDCLVSVIRIGLC
ncbi:hypothetical protein LUZ60_017111 [Juncus effusus]|nr:hypothetical protein LUZ60_017111 [Juncus effusus]